MIILAAMVTRFSVFIPKQEVRCALFLFQKSDTNMANFNNTCWVGSGGPKLTVTEVSLAANARKGRPKK